MNISLSRTMGASIFACLIALLVLPFTALSVAAAPQADAPDIANEEAIGNTLSTIEASDVRRSQNLKLQFIRFSLSGGSVQ